MDKYRIMLHLGDMLLDLPVLPEKLTVKCSADSAEKTVLQLGSVNLIKGTKLRQISFASFFPANKIPAGSAAHLRSPLWYVQWLRRTMDCKKPLRFILLGNDLDINVQMSVESFEYSESYGAVGDIDYKLTLKEWVDHSPKKVTIKENKAIIGGNARSGQPESAPADKAVKYTVKSGDCLWGICKAKYNDGTLYDRLYQYNKTVIDKMNEGRTIRTEVKTPAQEPVYPGKAAGDAYREEQTVSVEEQPVPKYTIYVGQVLTLPPKEEL